MNSLRLIIVVLLSSVIQLTGCASKTSQDIALVSNADQLQNAAPVATVTIETIQIRLILGGSWGEGDLHYQGQTYPFTIKGLILDGIGIMKSKVEGDVYLLNKLEDFPGTYSDVSMGAALVKGKGGASIQNNRGVFIQLRSATTGSELGLETGGVKIQFKE